jgi:hypothetical protein
MQNLGSLLGRSGKREKQKEGQESSLKTEYCQWFGSSP